MSGFSHWDHLRSQAYPKNGWKMKPEPKKLLQDACNKTLSIHMKALYRSTHETGNCGSPYLSLCSTVRMSDTNQTQRCFASWRVFFFRFRKELSSAPHSMPLLLFNPPHSFSNLPYQFQQVQHSGRKKQKQKTESLAEFNFLKLLDTFQKHCMATLMGALSSY